MKKFFEKYETLFFFLIMIIIGVISIIIKEYAITISCGLTIIFYLFIIALGYILDLKNYIYNKKIKSIFEKYNSKGDKTLFESLFIKAYKGIADDEINEILRILKIKGVNSLDVRCGDDDFIILNFRRKNYDVYMNIYNKKVAYLIDTPSRYDYFEENKNMEKLNVLDVNINSFLDLTEFYRCISSHLKDIVNKIDSFEENNSNKFIIGSKKMDELNYFRRFYKGINILLLVLSLILAIALGVITYFAVIDIGFIDDFREVFIYLCIVSLNGFVVFAIIYAIYFLLFTRKISLDLGRQETFDVKGRPYKISLGSERWKHSNGIYLKYIKLYFTINNSKVKVMVICDYRYKKINKKALFEKIKDTNFEIKALKKSGIAISGTNSINIKKYIIK